MPNPTTRLTASADRVRGAWRWLFPLAFLVFFHTSLIQAAPVNFETGAITVEQTGDGNTWHAAVFARSFDTPPVVVMGPATRNGADPMVLRVRNVTTTGFEFQMDEWDYKDGYHTTETFHFLALSEGVHQFGSQTWEAGRVGAINRSTSTISLTGFTAAPVVLAQVESTNNIAVAAADGVMALKTRLDLVTDASFRVRLETEEAGNSLTLLDEAIGYIAISEGAGYLDGLSVEVGRTGLVVDEVWEPITFAQAAVNPIFLAQTNTRAGGDPGELRMRNLTSTGVEVVFEEEASANSEVGHVDEDVGYVVFSEMAGEADAKLEIGEVVIDQNNAASWTQVTLAQSYTNPVVIPGPIGWKGGQAANIRVQNVTATGFEIQVDEWDHIDGGHADEPVSYMVMEAGTYAIGGHLWEAGVIAAANATPAAAVLSAAFAEAPAVFPQVVTTNDPNALVARVNNVTATGFDLQVDQSEIDTSAQSDEVVHYLAVQKGSTAFFTDGMRVEAGTEDGLTNGWKWQSFGRPHADPYLFAATQTINDTDPISVRFRYLFGDEVEIRVQEDEHPGANNGHAAETLAWLVVQGSVDTDGDGAPDAWETSVGLDPNDAADGVLDPDGDTLTHQQEYHNVSDHLAYSGGNLTLSVVNNRGDAIEADGTEGRYRISRSGSPAPLTVTFAMSGTPGTNATLSTADASDYTLETTGGAPLSTTVSLVENATSVDIDLVPVQDNDNEYPEGAVMSIVADSNYTISGGNSSTIVISDATDDPANDKLFVGTFGPEGSAQTGGNGIATLIINGSNTQARISTSFSGLTTEQLSEDGCHVHISNGGTKVFEGNEAAAGGGLTFPPGAVTDYPWAIQDYAGRDASEIIDALYKEVAGLNLYINIHTDLYMAGEISAEFTRQDGSPVFNPPGAAPALEDLASDEEARRDCARFLIQATFGPTEAEIDALFNSIPGDKTLAANRLAAFNAWIDAQFALPQSSLYAIHYAADQQEWALRAAANTGIAGYPQNAVDWHKLPNPFNGLGKESYDVDHNNRRRGWWTLAMTANDQLRHRVAFALEQILIISDREAAIRNRAYGHSTYYDQLATGADGNYRDLLETVSKSPMMGKYLSHLYNQKETTDSMGNVIVSPDENYAREIMQLFSIGLLERHPDGTLKLGQNGLPIQTYTNVDIKELSRVFTGWSFARRNEGSGQDWAIDPDPNTAFLYGGGNEYFHIGYMSPMKNFPDYHDEGAKTFLGGTNPAIGAGEDREAYAEADMDAALDRIHNHPNTAPFLARLLIQRLVSSNPSAGYIYRVAQAYEDNGSGVRGDMGAVVRAILTDYEARSLTLVDPVTNGSVTSVNIGHGKVKEPIIGYIQLLRAIGAESVIPASDLVAYGYGEISRLKPGATMFRYGDTLNPLSQRPQGMPSVFNWFLPDYSPGGDISLAGLVAPELQILTENPVVAAVNYSRQVEYSSITQNPPESPRPTGQNVNTLYGQDASLDNVVGNIEPYLSYYTQQLAVHGNDATLAAKDLIDRLDDLLCAGSLAAKYPYPPDPGTTNPRSIIIDQVAIITGNNRAKAALYLITSSPEFIVQK